MKILTCILFIFILHLNLFSQLVTNSCLDSSERIRYNFPLNQLLRNFGPDGRGAFLFGGGQTNAVVTEAALNCVFGKMNHEGKLLWAKIVHKVPDADIGEITGFDCSANAIYWIGNNETNKKFFIIKTDLSGNIINSFSYIINYATDNDRFWLKKIKYVSDNEIYLIAEGNGGGGPNSHSNLIIKIKSDGSVDWSKAFVTGDGYAADYGRCDDIFTYNNEVYIFGGFNKSDGIRTEIYGFFSMKLNPLNGNLITMRSSSIPSIHTDYSYGGYLLNTFKVVNTSNGLQLFACITGGPISTSIDNRNKIIKITLDSTYTISKGIEIQPATPFSFARAYRIDINKNNETCVLFNEGTEYYYSLFNSKDSLAGEKKIIQTLREPFGFYADGLCYDSAGTIYDFAQYHDQPYYFNRYELFKLKKNWQNSTADCMGEDTRFVTVKNISFRPYNFSWNAIVTDAVQREVLNMAASDFIVREETLCKEISVCDTIKIMGNTKFCLNNPIATFTVYKNPQCLRKTQWLLDTGSIKIINQPDNNTITVKFIKPYRGYIKASFEECVLQDSLYIEVNNLKQNLFLGNDTILCPNKTIILNAGAGFKTYNWQDGSTNQTFTVSKSGTYYVTAMDSCDNAFRDTIVIKPMDISFALNYPAPICRYDTAKLFLTPQLKNYSWAPANYGTLSANTLQLFPETTTLFTVSAERYMNCILTDTVLIQVEKCPVYLDFPNAFTPNNDGKNDGFKPVVKGTVVEYYFAIYNRYGQKIFTSNTPNTAWDGTISGAPQNPGVFAWQCRYKMKNEPVKFVKGTVILIR